jgi:endonuclease/exonuclease/phosphatase family metal-dependent hydrolase
MDGGMKGTLIFACMLLSSSLSATEFTVVSFNIRYATEQDGPNAWSQRKAWVPSLLQFHGAEVFGLQESLYEQVKDVESRMPDYDWVGVGRDDGRQGGEYSPIFFDRRRFECIEQGTFWLSEHPHEPGKGWDAAFPRVCTWVHLRERDEGRTFYILNTHFDHLGNEARARSAELLIARVQSFIEQTSSPVVLLGDFNLTPESSPIRQITETLRDSRDVSELAPYGPEGTFTGFVWDYPEAPRIDYIFVSEGISVMQYAVLSDSVDHRFPSDHFSGSHPSQACEVMDFPGLFPCLFLGGVFRFFHPECGMVVREAVAPIRGPKPKEKT